MPPVKGTGAEPQAPRRSFWRRKEGGRPSGGESASAGQLAGEGEQHRDQQDLGRHHADSLGEAGGKHAEQAFAVHDVEPDAVEHEPGQAGTQGGAHHPQPQSASMEALPLLGEEQTGDQSHQSGGDSEAGEEGAEGEEGGADQVAYRAHGQSPQGAKKDAGQGDGQEGEVDHHEGGVDGEEPGQDDLEGHQKGAGDHDLGVFLSFHLSLPFTG